MQMCSLNSTKVVHQWTASNFVKLFNKNNYVMLLEYIFTDNLILNAKNYT